MTQCTIQFVCMFLTHDFIFNLCIYVTTHPTTSTITSPPPQQRALNLRFNLPFSLHERTAFVVFVDCLVVSQWHNQSHYFVLLLPRFRLFLTESCVYVLDYRARVQVSRSVGRERLHLHLHPAQGHWQQLRVLRRPHRQQGRNLYQGGGLALHQVQGHHRPWHAPPQERRRWVKWFKHN